MRCVAVSDTHMRDVITPEADLLIVGGDTTFKGTPEELAFFCDWLKRQPQKHKVWIAGNHELELEDNPELGPLLAKETGSIYLNDSAVEIEGLKIWGSPITPWYYDWAFNRHRGRPIRKHWDAIPEGLDILITHGPPHGSLDVARGGLHAGCEELYKVLMGMMLPPRYHIFGHIHSGYGQKILRRPDGKTITLLNASICNEKYENANKPFVFNIVPSRKRSV